MSAFVHFSKLSAVIILCLCSSVFAYSGGNGATQPYQIATVADWQQLMATSGHWSSRFIMTADVNLYGVALTPVGNASTKFTGTFDGNDHIISNAVINQPGSNNVGLFGCINTNGVIRNLRVEDINVAGNYYVGGLVGFNYQGTINNCCVGGIISGQSYVGGLTGYNTGSTGTIWDCYATSNVSGSYYVGGLAGYISNIYLSNSYATGDVNGQFTVGGLVGTISSGLISECYSAGAVSGISSVGGLIGSGNYALSCFWDVNTTGQTTSAGGSGAVGKTTAEMKMLSTFLNAGWDFSGELENGQNEIWQPFVDGTDYPHLRWEYPKTYYSGGEGTEEDPYQIGNVFDWLQLMNSTEDWSKHFLMTADVNLAELTLKPIGDYTVEPLPRLPIPLSSIIKFSGVFDGGGHIISNVSMDTDSNYTGLFGITDANSEIRNLGVINVDITPSVSPFAGNIDYIGGLAGMNGGTISNCYANGEVSGRKYIGILVGTNNDGVISNCYSNGTVWGYQFVGGLCGHNIFSTINQSYSNATVDGVKYVGGLTGYNTGMTPISKILNCHSTGSVSGGQYVGGLAGDNGGEITNCYAAGTVYSSVSPPTPSNTGGLVGYSESGTILTSYASGQVSGSAPYIGGLIGYNSGSTISNCYASGQVSNSAPYIGGLVGWNSSSISNSYATGAVISTSSPSSSYAGGLVGYCSGGSISKCYSAGAVSGSTLYIGGLVGYATMSVSASFWDVNSSGQTTSAGGPGAVGKTTAEMKTYMTFAYRYGSARWDFVGETYNGTNDYWRMCVDGVDYPKLSWEFKAGDFKCPDGVDIYDLKVLAGQWLFEGNYIADIAPIDGDGIVNMLDFAAFAENWLLK